MEIVKKDKNNIESTKGNIYKTPECDIYENDNEYIMYFDIPGVNKDDISLKVEKDVLSLTADCSKKAGETYNCLRDEMMYSGFKRSFDLGGSVDSDEINADYKNGTLKLVLPKKEKQKTKQISINVS